MPFQPTRSNAKRQNVHVERTSNRERERDGGDWRRKFEEALGDEREKNFLVMISAAQKRAIFELTGDAVESRTWHLTLNRDEHYSLTVSTGLSGGVESGEKVGISMIVKETGGLDSVCVHKGKFAGSIGVGTRLIMSNDLVRWPVAEKLASDLFSSTWHPGLRVE